MVYQDIGKDGQTDTITLFVFFEKKPDILAVKPERLLVNSIGCDSQKNPVITTRSETGTLYANCERTMMLDSCDQPY